MPKSRKDQQIVKDLNLSVGALASAITELRTESDQYYATGDNHRGNIRNDAADRLEGDLHRLIIGRDYITLALRK